MYLQTVNPHLQHLNTAEPVLQLYSDENHRVHIHLSLPCIMTLTDAVRLNQDHLRSGHTMEQYTSESLLPRHPRPAS